MSKKQLVLAAVALAGAAALVLLLGPFDLRYGIAALAVVAGAVALYIVRALRRVGSRAAQTVRNIRTVHALVKQQDARLEGAISSLGNVVAQDRFELVTALDAQTKAVEAVASQLAAVQQRLRDVAGAKDVQRLAKDVERVRKSLTGVEDRTSQAIRAAERNGLAQVTALLELRGLLQPRTALPPLRGVPATTLVRLVREVLDRGPAVVVACGTGVSTLWIGYALEKLGHGRCIALEHDPEAARAAREALDLHGLSSIVEVRDARLLPLEVTGESCRWYDLVALEGIRDVGIIFVDGPPESRKEDVRLPAVPVLRRYLGERGAHVILAHADEPADKAAFQRWCEEFDVRALVEWSGEPGSASLSVPA